MASSNCFLEILSIFVRIPNIIKHLLKLKTYGHFHIFTFYLGVALVKEKWHSASCLLDLVGIHLYAKNLKVFLSVQELCPLSLNVMVMFSVCLLFLFSLNGACHAKKCLQTCAKCPNSDHPAYSLSIIRAFTLFSCIL